MTEVERSCLDCRNARWKSDEDSLFTRQDGPIHDREPGFCNWLRAECVTPTWVQLQEDIYNKAINADRPYINCDAWREK